MQKITALLAAARAPEHANVQVVGAGARNAASTISTRLPLLGPDEEEAMLMEAGFAGTRLFYAGLAFRGWVTYA